MGRLDRQMAARRLSAYFEGLIKQSDTDLLHSVQCNWPAVKEASREECLKFLVLDFVSKNFDC
jgi:hypothetical protein